MSELPAQLTEQELNELSVLQDRIVSKALRDKVFLPFALQLLNYEIIYTTRMPLPVPAMTDQHGKIWIDPKSELFSVQGQYGRTHDKLSILTMLMMHEISHPMLMHDIRLRHRDPVTWNVAGDFVINLLHMHLEQEAKTYVKKPLVQMGIKEFPKSHITLSEDFTGMIEEEIYEQLIGSKKVKSQFYMSMQDVLDYMGGKSNDQPDPKETKDEVNGPAVKVTELEYDINGKKKTVTNVECPQVPPANKQEEEDRKKRARNVELGRQQLQDTFQKGVGSAELRRFLGRLLKVKIDWGPILKDSLMTAFEPSFNQIWHRPRTVWLANPYMPYLPNFDVEEKYGIVFVSIDESGSMGDSDVQKAVEIVIQAREKYKALYVIKHDYDNIWTSYYEEDLSASDIKELCHRQHCGGTSHKWVFKEINSFIREHPDEIASAYIGITDLYSDVETCQRDFPTNIPRIWIVNSDHKIEGLIGRVIRTKD